MEGKDKNKPSPSPETTDGNNLPRLITPLAIIYIRTALYNLLSLRLSQLCMFYPPHFSGIGSEQGSYRLLEQPGLCFPGQAVRSLSQHCMPIAFIDPHSGPEPQDVRKDAPVCAWPRPAQQLQNL